MDEMIVTAAYLRIRVPTKSLKKMTPFEAYHKMKPNVSHLREIGSRAFVLILNKHNPKIFQCSEECVLVGYSKDSKSYWLYHRPSHQIIESFHVVFIESKDDWDKPFRPGVTQGLDDDADVPSQNIPPVAPTASAVPHVIPAPVSVVPVAPPAPATSRKSSRIPAPSTRLAEATGFSKISAVQQATTESRMSKAHLDADRAQRKRTRTVSNDPTLPQAHTRTRTRTTSNRPTGIPTPTPPLPASSTPFDANLTSETELAHILEALANDGFDWGLASDDDFDAKYPDDPATLEEALASEDAPKWLAGCKEELASINKLSVFKLVPRSQCTGWKVLKGKFVFRVKRDALGKAVHWKVRYVAKGYEAVYGVDYKKTASPTMRLETFRIIAHLSAVFGWKLHQIDIVTAFLRGALAEGEEVYMEQPNGFKVDGREDDVWMLQKGLYGLPQGSRLWNKTMHDGMASIGFLRIPCEYCIYFRKTDDGIIMTEIHVDDFLAGASSDDAAAKFETDLATLWEISDLGEARFCISIAIERDLANHYIYLSQTALIDRILVQFHMTDANPVTTPMEAGVSLSKFPAMPLTGQEELELKTIPYRRLIGCLMYLAVGTRPDISLAVTKLSQFLDCYNLSHWLAAKRVLCYLIGTRHLKLHLGGHVTSDIVGFSDASFACCPDSARSIGAYCFSLGESGVVSWCARKQKTVAQSSCDAEYIAVSEVAREAMWLQMLTTELGFPPLCATPLLCDNQAALVLTEDPSFHTCAKHINTKWHYIRECTENNSIAVSYVPSRDNVADILTKALPAQAFLRLRSFLGLCTYP